ncbi:MAG TPA: GNAT family N-acetyltransferase [Vicinamibacteria bacterium]
MSVTARSVLPVTLRDAAAGDAAAIAAIYNHYVVSSTCTYQTEPDTEEGRAAWLAQHGDRYPVIVAEMDGEVVGWGCLSRYHSRAAYAPTVENSVYVRHDLHGRGIGGALLAELIRRAGALGYRSILAGVSADQAASVALHEKHGFEKVGHLREVGFKFGRRLDVVWLQRML